MRREQTRKEKKRKEEAKQSNDFRITNRKTFLRSFQKKKSFDAENFG